MQRSIDAYLHYQALRGAVFWLPVFVLWFQSALPLEQVLWLEAVYYVGVVLFEVPTGWWADRFGQRNLLVIGSVVNAAGCALIALFPSLWPWAVGQLLLAFGMAASSGADSSLLHDVLERHDALDQQAEIESKAEAWSLAAMAAASILGGLLGPIALWGGHALTAIASVAAAARVSQVQANPHVPPSRSGMGVALEATAASHPLRWWLAAGAMATLWVHLPYELAQPWLVARLGDPHTTPWAAWASGALSTLAMGLGALSAQLTTTAMRTLGARLTALTSLRAITSLTGLLAVAPTSLGLALLALRGVPGAVFRPTLRAAVHPHLPAGARATWLSLWSLAGRLGFAVALLVSGALTPELGTEGVLAVWGALGLFGTIGLTLTRRRS